MSDFTKIIDHPEKTTIISKLVNGETPKIVAAYLKDKYTKPDESHLRLGATLLQEFLDTYADHHGYVKKIIQNNADTKLEKKIADSLLDTRAWKERLSETVEKEVNYLAKLDHLLTIIESRTEQLFDLIQSDPEGTRTDYIFTKYLEMFMLAIEKGDKIRNDKPDIKIEHTYTFQMVEQQTIAFQEAIKRVLDRLGPDYSSIFMDLLSEEMGKINPKKLDQTPISNEKQFERDRLAIDKLSAEVTVLDQKFIEEDLSDDIEPEGPNEI
jgi:hypothetical protein